jgi:hypothetical protein
MSLSFLVLIVACILAGIGAWTHTRPAPAPPWYGYFFPLSWFLFLLFLCITHGGGINWHG